MSETKRIKTALVSVYHKEGLDEIITKLHEEGVEFLSTGGTRQFIESLGYPCKAVEDLTTYPSILGGRVKTLHPKVFGGILCRRGLERGRFRFPLLCQQPEDFTLWRESASERLFLWQSGCYVRPDSR